MNDAVARLATLAGILPGYRDVTGERHETGHETRLALLAVIGLGVSGEAEARDRVREIEAQEAARTLPRWLILRPGVAADTGLSDRAEWRISLEDGGALEGRGPGLPPLPLGLHRLALAGQETTLLCAPETAPQPRRGWGVTLPLWGLRGAGCAGLGDFHDLRAAGLALADHGAAFAGINPVHAGFPEDSANFSPYAPSHRRFLNVLHIATGDDGAAAGPLVDYGREIPAKRAALRAAYDRFCADGDPTGFEAFRATRGAGLHRFAAHQALSARHGPYWPDWPAPARAPETAPLDGLEPEIRYHSWLQWRAEAQLGETQHALTGAGMRHAVR